MYLFGEIISLEQYFKIYIYRKKELNECSHSNTINIILFKLFIYIPTYCVYIITIL